MKIMIPTKKIYTIAFSMIGIGLASIIISYFSGIAGERIAANILLNSYYFLYIGLIGLFFIAAHTVADSGWHTSVQRVGEAMAAFIPLAGVLLVAFFAAGGLHTVYAWTDQEHLDEVLLKKVAWLNVPFFYIRLVIYFALWTSLAFFIRKNSLLTDQHGGLKYFRNMKTLSAVFLVVFAITSVTSSWDWLMSLDPHWFSTLYGWYVFSSMLAGGTAMLIIIVLILKYMGHLQHVNKEHIHDLGKYLFGFSIFWAYLWFSQYLLIWYGNLPEETVYFTERFNGFSTFFYANVILNFTIPLLGLMARNSKRGTAILLPMAFIVFIGHWVDLYQLIMPGAAGVEKAGLGIPEIGITTGYAGIFVLVVFRALSKAPLAPVNHPFFEESLEYHT